ncbi:uncharacterized protein SPPG_02572 [Spizellomyces punctatus DAOM BR117]|uniref:Methyltransferase domain-containing protein n=1 Tax=Spizellomyces punctatus (strain DAOM BR117) TaxID=645134 RepID=A0A0L0HMQ8_SPIPD|nr:uncharacterized protein SPPG_02572 [Spizellomyces punctatus DAOM BR117]KND02069.1 hypothetical protein SPPG_02572 [Spizellomyces punctatus DAOM BR117]|eukprot:XP_016610108.1 hypothetical protein SPPG_02572 [Spizellomyces punctatus DAOM BR117]
MHDTRPNQEHYSFANAPVPDEIPDASLAFLKAYTGEQNLNALKERVFDIWRESRERLHVYKCVQTLMFLEPRITKHSLYPTILQSFQQAQKSNLPPPRILDAGCAYGTDVRALIHHGVPASQIAASDLHDGYWKLGQRLYNDSERIHAVKTTFGDMAVPAGAVGAVEASSIEPLTYIAASAVLHVFSAAQCEAFLRRILSLLEFKGIFLGTCVGALQEGEWRRGRANEGNAGSVVRYLHSAKSLKALMEQIGFVDVKVESHGPEDPTASDDPVKKIWIEFQGKKP